MTFGGRLAYLSIWFIAISYHNLNYVVTMTLTTTHSKYTN